MDGLAASPLVRPRLNKTAMLRRLWMGKIEED